MDRPPIFLVGCHRSGTTLLRYLLDAHPRLACPPETKFIAALEAALRYPQALAGLASLGVSHRAVLDTCAKLVDSVMTAYATRRGKTRWIDKTPNYYRLLPLIDSMLQGQVQYIFLVRHPLDNILSLARVCTSGRWSDDPDIRTCLDRGAGLAVWAEHWLTVNRCLEEWSNAHTSRCHWVTYEGLVANTASELEGICTQIGEQYVDTLITDAFQKPHDVGFGDTLISMTRRVHPGRVGVYRTVAWSELENVWAMTEELATRWSYTVEEPGTC